MFGTAVRFCGPTTDAHGIAPDAYQGGLVRSPELPKVQRDKHGRVVQKPVNVPRRRPGEPVVWRKKVDDSPQAPPRTGFHVKPESPPPGDDRRDSGLPPEARGSYHTGKPVGSRPASAGALRPFSTQPLQFRDDSRSRVPTTFGAGRRLLIVMDRKLDSPGPWDYAPPAVPASQSQTRRAQRQRPSTAPMSRTMSTQPTTFRKEKSYVKTTFGTARRLRRARSGTPSPVEYASPAIPVHKEPSANRRRMQRALSAGQAHLRASMPLPTPSPMRRGGSSRQEEVKLSASTAALLPKQATMTPIALRSGQRSAVAGTISYKPRRLGWGSPSQSVFAGSAPSEPVAGSPAVAQVDATPSPRDVVAAAPNPAESPQPAAEEPAGFAEASPPPRATRAKPTLGVVIGGATPAGAAPHTPAAEVVDTPAGLVIPWPDPSPASAEPRTVSEVKGIPDGPRTPLQRQAPPPLLPTPKVILSPASTQQSYTPPGSPSGGDSYTPPATTEGAGVLSPASTHNSYTPPGTPTGASVLSPAASHQSYTPPEPESEEEKAAEATAVTVEPKPIPRHRRRRASMITMGSARRLLASPLATLLPAGLVRRQPSMKALLEAPVASLLPDTRAAHPPVSKSFYQARKRPKGLPPAPMRQVRSARDVGNAGRLVRPKSTAAMAPPPGLPRPTSRVSLVRHPSAYSLDSTTSDFMKGMSDGEDADDVDVTVTDLLFGPMGKQRPAKGGLLERRHSASNLELTAKLDDLDKFLASIVQPDAPKEVEGTQLHASVLAMAAAGLRASLLIDSEDGSLEESNTGAGGDDGVLDESNPKVPE